MFTRLRLALGLVLWAVFAAAAFASSPGLSRLSVAPPNAYGSMDGVATFGGMLPSAAQLETLRAMGLQVQGFNRLPLALLRGPKQAMFDAVAAGIAADVYPNDRVELHSAPSNLSIRANEVHALGIDGQGVGVAIIDSGIDASHPDLSQRVTHNVKIIETGVPDGNIVIPVEQLPYNNSDTSSGHGTHVAGIAAADNTDGQMIGVAPGADLIGFGAGDVVFIFSILSSYDLMLEKRVDWKIRVANNSWGSSFRLFDPNEPINQATKAAHDAGIVVVFSAGNSSTEMAINPYSVAPWVISVGAGGLNRQRADFSSGGLQFDNSVLMTLPAGTEKHMSFTGDRIGLYHPSVSAPGVDIESTATTGIAITSLPGGTASASGTSMSAPHVAGLVALMLQKRPSLTFAEIKSVLQVTASLMPYTEDSTLVQPFWQSGYGWIDAKAAVDLVGRHRFKQKALDRMQRSADQRVLGDRDHKVLRTDYWTFNAAPATFDGVPDNRTFMVDVPATTEAIKGLVSYPSLGYVGLNFFNYQLALRDAAGQVVAESTPASNAGMSQFFVDLSGGAYTFGTWTLNVRGDLGAQDQDVLMGILVSVALHQLEGQERVSPAMPTFTATGTQTFYFQRGAAGALASPEGCDQQAGAPDGGLDSARPAGTCQTGSMGYVTNYGAGIPASFVSAPLTAPLTVGGDTAMKLYLVDPAQPFWSLAQNPRVVLEIDAIDENGDLVMAIGTAEWTVCNGSPRVCNTGPQPVGGVYAMSIPPVTIPAGTRLAVLVRETALVASAARTVYGGAGLTGDYSDAGVTFTVGTLQ